jgi:hypothetical protein
MKYTDNLTDHYQEILDGHYDCIDRIVLNAYCPMLLVPGGVRNFYRKLKGSDKDLDTNALMRFAGRFSRRIQAYAKSKSIPFKHFQSGVHKHTEAEALLPKDKSFTGIFAIFCSRAPSLLWEVKKFESGSIDIRRKKKLSFVTHYYFHIIDKEWGHITVRMCAHPPFSCNVILNGHEWVERRKGLQSLQIKKDGNCFTSYTDGAKLSQIADTLKTKGRFEEVCRRWVYGCLWFVMDQRQQKETGFQYKFSVYQVEYSRNLLFRRGRQLDDVYQNIINLTRDRLAIPRLRTIFGKKRRPYKHKSKASAPEVRIETPDYDLTIIKIHFGKLTVKLYDKGERTLRAEVVVHNSKALGCKRSLEYFSEILEKLQQIMKGFMNHLNYAHVAIINDGKLEELTRPSRKGKSRLAGIDLTKKRNIAIMQVSLALSMKPDGFTCSDISKRMKRIFGGDYTARKASYDLRKLRAKGLVRKKEGAIKYFVSQEGIQIMVAILSLWEKELPALLAVLNNENLIRKDKILSSMEKYVFNMQSEINNIKNLFGIKKAA